MDAIEKLQQIIAWAEGADPTDAVLRLSAVDYEAALNWRNVAVLTVDDVRALLSSAKQVRNERDELRAAIEAAMRIEELWSPLYHEPEYEHENIALSMMRDGFVAALASEPEKQETTDD